MVDSIKRPKVTIGVLTYNHESYIEECLNSVISQTGNFDLEIIIVNDKSKDDTDQKIKMFLARHKDINIKYAINPKNIGAQKSIYKILNLIKDTESDYWSYIEGDDKYLDEKRTQKHIDNLQSNDGALISYNKLLLINEKSELISKHEPRQLSETLTTERLASQNHIGSFCATFYKAECFKYFDVSNFEGLTVYDWFFNIWMSQYGTIKLVPEYLSGYRQHSASVWSSKSQTEQYGELIKSIDNYNKKLKFSYDRAFQSYKRNIINQLFNIGSSMGVDVAIMSDSFPVIKDAFTEEQITYIINSSENNVILCSTNTHKKNRDSFLDAIKQYKQVHPEIAPKIIGYDGDYSLQVRAIYALSIDDAYLLALPIVRRHDVPFVFQISSRDEKNLSNKETIRKLRKIFRAANLKKLIVHSELAKRMIVANKFCSEDGVALIPSSVSEKIFGRDKMYEPEQMKSYLFQINDLLNKSVRGELRPLAPASIVFLRKIRKGVPRRLKSLLKRNRLVHMSIKKTLSPLRALISMLKSVK